MKLFRELVSMLKQRNKHGFFKEIPGWLLVVIGGLSGAIVVYLTDMLKQVRPEYSAIVNTHGIDTVCFAIGVFLVFISILALIHGTLAARTGVILCERCLK